jgi:2-haloacid dehalogenase
MPLASPFGPETIDWVFLDAYSTIVQEDYALLAEACHEMARSTKGRHAAEEIGQWWEDRFHSLCDTSSAERFVLQRDIVTRSLADTVRHFRIDMDQGPWLEAIFAYSTHPTLHHDTRAFLEAAGVPVCVVSNIDDDDFRLAAEYACLSFEHVVTSEGTRSYKPDPGIFREALRVTGADPSRVLHVGDSFRADVVGAKGAGLRVARLNRKGQTPPADATVEPDAEVASLVDLLARTAT